MLNNNNKRSDWYNLGCLDTYKCWSMALYFTGWYALIFFITCLGTDLLIAANFLVQEDVTLRYFNAHWAADVVKLAFTGSPK